MNMGRVLLCIVLVGAGVVIGAGGYAYLSARASDAGARANLLASGESIRSGKLVAAMNHAQAALNEAPQSYESYEAVGDVYARLGLPEAAAKMYEAAIQQLASRGNDSMLVTRGVVSSDGAAALVKQKLRALPFRPEPAPRKD